MYIDFNVTAVPPKGGKLTDVLSIDNADSWVADNEGGYYPPSPLTRYNCYYEFKWESPPPPHMAVEHDGFYGTHPTAPGAPDEWPLSYGPYPPTAVGAAFDAKTYVEDLAAAWGLTNATFCLCYNTTVIDVAGEADAVPPASTTFELIETMGLNVSDDGEIPINLTVAPNKYYASESGEVFNVTVRINDVDPASKLIAVTFRLSYDPSLLDVVDVVEGPFLPYWASQQPGSLGTFFTNFTESDGVYGPHVLVGDLILPNATGKWNPPFPEGSGTIATITFRVKPLLDITLNTAVWDPDTSVITVTHGVPDRINFTVYPKEGVVPSGKVLVATVNFTILIQQESPPYAMGYYDYSMLEFCGVKLADHIRTIPTDPAENGEVRILAMVALTLAWLEVSPKDTVLAEYGEYAIGEEFDVNVTIKNLHAKWYLIAYQFRLSFDPALLQLVGVTEGPFLTDPRWNLYGTFFVSGEEPDGIFGHHVWAAGILLPNDTTGEYDQTIYPSAPGPDVADLAPPVNPVLATIRFKAIDQEFCFEAQNLTCGLDILPFWLPENYHFVDVDGNYIPTDTPKIVNGTYTICGSFMVGRLIDVYGGAENRGYGTAQPDVTNYRDVGVIWPSPYGGQGVNGTMDLVIPQSVVYLFANVTYNHWPVQSKDVGFEIEGPFEQAGWTPENPVPRHQGLLFVRKYSNRTSTGECGDPGGVAWIKFQMPWPCDDPESYFGKYRVTATVDICGNVTTDVLWFDYYYLVEITKVTTDKDAYPHCNDVEITIEYRSKAQQSYPVLFSVVIQDELETAFGAKLNSTQGVQKAEFCHWKTYKITVTVHVEKWAFAGIAHIYVSAFDWDPTDISPITRMHGAPWLPTFGIDWPEGETVPEILILPY